MLSKDQDKRPSAKEALQHPWFTEEDHNENLDDAMENFKEFEEEDAAPKNAPNTASNNLITVTPVMAGRHLKDTCESPWLPSGYTPKTDPKTPLLINGFDDDPKRKLKILSVDPNDEDDNQKEEQKTPNDGK
jgi:hypothetical protein